MVTLTYAEMCRYPDLKFHMVHSVFPGQACQMHDHEFTELVIVRHGRARHRVNDGEFALEAGDAFVVRPEDVHGYEAMEGLDLLNILFCPDQFLPPQSDLRRLPGFHMLFHLEPLYRDTHHSTSRLRLQPDALRQVYDIVEPMEREYEGGEPGFECQIRAYFNLLVVYLCRLYGEQRTPGAGELLRLSRVQSHLHTHYGELITLDELAAMASMSKNTFLRAFRRCYGSSPMSYLARVRLAKACELLATSDRSVTAIAQSVGFADHSHFTRTFHKAYGRSPREYRRNFQFIPQPSAHAGRA